MAPACARLAGTVHLCMHRICAAIRAGGAGIAQPCILQIRADRAGIAQPCIPHIRADWAGIAQPCIPYIRAGGEG